MRWLLEMPQAGAIKWILIVNLYMNGKYDIFNFPEGATFGAKEIRFLCKILISGVIYSVFLNVILDYSRIM